MKRRVFIHQSPQKPVGGVFLGVKRDSGLKVERLAPGTAFRWLERDYYIGKGGELRRGGR